jgi:hypothetical protein
MKKTLLLFAALLLFTWLAVSKAGTNRANLTWTDPNKATAEDADFSIQGEYGVDEKGQAWGLHVVALGDGQFDAYLLQGGLPGLGWDRERARIKLHGTRRDGIVSLNSQDGGVKATIVDGRVTVYREQRQIADLPRILRKSPTLGAKPPQGAIVLFDGTNADAWINGRVEDGLLPNNDITTRQTFSDYQLHVEFRTPYKPYARGQRRGNSGVYHQGRYETQVLDSFGLEGRADECGGIYGIAAPRLNMCFPPLSWQTFDVDFTAARFDPNGALVEHARITVRHNGVVIHQDQNLPRTTAAAPVPTITPEPGPIFLQHHANPVYFRNIWIVPR